MKAFLIVIVCAIGLTASFMIGRSDTRDYDEIRRKYEALLKNVNTNYEYQTGFVIVDDKELSMPCMTNDMFILKNVQRKRYVYIPFVNDKLLETTPLLLVKAGNSIVVNHNEYIEFDCGENHFEANYECHAEHLRTIKNNAAGCDEIGPGMKIKVYCAHERLNRGAKDPNNCYITFLKTTN